LNDCLSVAENRMGIHPLYGLTKDNLKAVFGLSGGQQNGALGQEDTRPDIFPYYDSASSPGVFIIALPEGSMAVFGPVPETVRSPKDSRASCCDWLRQEGWLSLRDWYCKRLHKAPGGEEGAWWAVLDRTSASVIRSFSIEWGQTQVTTLDLLLIGSKGTDGPNWYGAAVSNLTSNRTECTVQLVTNEQRLQSIASSVEQLCNGFRKPADGTQFPVQRFGTWRKWPTAEWSSSEMSAARAAGAGLPLATGRESVATEQSTPQPPKNA